MRWGGGGELQDHDQRINIFPDMSAKLREQRAEFNTMRNILRSAKLKQGLVHPAKLLITFDKVTHTFTKAEDAMDFYQKQIKPTLDGSRIICNQTAN